MLGFNGCDTGDELNHVLGWLSVVVVVVAVVTQIVFLSCLLGLGP